MENIRRRLIADLQDQMDYFMENKRECGLADLESAKSLADLLVCRNMAERVIGSDVVLDFNEGVVIDVDYGKFISPMDVFLDTHIDDLGLTTYVYNRLSRVNIYTLRSLFQLRDFSQVRGLGPKTIEVLYDRVLECCQEHDIDFNEAKKAANQEKVSLKRGETLWLR